MNKEFSPWKPGDAYSNLNDLTPAYHDQYQYRQAISATLLNIYIFRCDSIPTFYPKPRDKLFTIKGVE